MIFYESFILTPSENTHWLWVIIYDSWVMCPKLRNFHFIPDTNIDIDAVPTDIIHTNKIIKCDNLSLYHFGGIGFILRIFLEKKSYLCEQKECLTYQEK